MLTRHGIMHGKLVTALVTLGIAMSTTAPAQAHRQPEDDGASQAQIAPNRLAFRGAVTIERDGNAVTAAHFDASSNPNVRYRLVIQNGCPPRSGRSSRPCPPPVDTLSVNLNEQTVFQSNGAFEVHRATLPRDAVNPQDNRLVITATGSPGATARVAIIATRTLR